MCLQKKIKTSNFTFDHITSFLLKSRKKNTTKSLWIGLMDLGRAVPFQAWMNPLESIILVHMNQEFHPLSFCLFLAKLDSFWCKAQMSSTDQITWTSSCWGCIPWTCIYCAAHPISSAPPLQTHYSHSVSWKHPHLPTMRSYIVQFLNHPYFEQIFNKYITLHV